MGDRDPFAFEWKWLVESGLSVKDFIAPTAFAFNSSIWLYSARTLSKASPAGGMRTDFSKLSASVAMFMKDSSKRIREGLHRTHRLCLQQPAHFPGGGYVRGHSALASLP